MVRVLSRLRVNAMTRNDLLTVICAAEATLPANLWRGNRSFTGEAYRRCMWQLSALGRVRSDVLALNAHVARAGCALACAYSSSEEFEAAELRSRRDAGSYSRKFRVALCAGGVVIIAAVALLMV